MAKQSYTLYELNEYIRRVMALNFAEPIWINCEIAQVKEARGNYYLELVEQDDNDAIKAQISAAIWYRSFLFIRKKLGTLTNSILSAGTHIQVKVQVEFNERYGLKLIIEDIDPSYTMGRLELKRQKILERLQSDGLLNLNEEVAMPTVVQRIAIISSDTAAGYKDFVAQLEENAYGYTFDITLFKAAMQGQNTEREVCLAIDEITSAEKPYDAYIIIRGGGSKLDLAAFDNFNIGHKIATSNIPAIIGIGHEIDQSVADIVAHTSLKTPTAVADFLIEKAALFEADIIQLNHAIMQESREVINRNRLNIGTINANISSRPMDRIYREYQSIESSIKAIEQYKSSILSAHDQALAHAVEKIQMSDPKKLLLKGYTLIKQGKKYVTSSDMLTSKPFEIQFANENVKAQKL